MLKNITNIKQIVSPSKFQKIQDDISLATGLAIITVDYKGIPITKHSGCSEFCKKVRASKYRAFCEKCDSHGGLEAARLGRPIIYFCHAGIIDLAVPFIVDDLYLGAFMAGQVLLEQDASKSQPKRVLQDVATLSEMTSDFQDSYANLPVMTMEKINALANMFLHIRNYCVELAILRDTKGPNNKEAQPFPWRDLPDKTKIERKEPNKLLMPALDYIKKHPQEKINLSKMADLCSISPSYFSKLFARENVGSLSDYVNNVKTECAKELLLTTDWPVGTIASQLGFDDTGYFIKVFKHKVKKTPLEYRESPNSALNVP